MLTLIKDYQNNDIEEDYFIECYKYVCDMYLLELSPRFLTMIINKKRERGLKNE